MQSEVARKLKAAAEDAAVYLSKPERFRNYRGEIFSVLEITPLSESVAAVVFQKSLGKRQGKRAIAFFYYRRANTTSWAGGWTWFLPTDSHLLGLSDFPKIKAEIERFNFSKNFGGQST